MTVTTFVPRDSAVLAIDADGVARCLLDEAAKRLLETSAISVRGKGKFTISQYGEAIGLHHGVLG